MPVNKLSPNTTLVVPRSIRLRRGPSVKLSNPSSQRWRCQAVDKTSHKLGWFAPKIRTLNLLIQLKRDTESAKEARRTNRLHRPNSRRFWYMRWMNWSREWRNTSATLATCPQSVRTQRTRSTVAARAEVDPVSLEVQSSLKRPGSQCTAR